MTDTLVANYAKLARLQLTIRPWSQRRTRRVASAWLATPTFNGSEQPALDCYFGLVGDRKETLPQVYQHLRRINGGRELTQL
ncbi:MAG: hypothetical protein IH991_21155 [Planctomycetes bacterium]|nr:hypothetical protein [Planctomycetota bacterium]